MQQETAQRAILGGEDGKIGNNADIISFNPFRRSTQDNYKNIYEATERAQDLIALWRWYKSLKHRLPGL